jgi:DNA-directed RNA polymerase specialized sigma24 family protein
MDAQSKDSASTTASQDKVARQHGVETRLAVERIAVFAAAARPEHLTPDIRTLFKRNILDSLGCAIARMLNITPTAVKVRLHRARQALKALVEREAGKAGVAPDVKLPESA